MRPPDQVLAALRDAPRPVCAYVYDPAALVERAAAVRAALPPGATLLYAMKANRHPDVVRALAEVCDGIEVASGGELDRAQAAGARRIVFGGPAKTPAELVAAIQAGAQINVESPLELHRILQAAASLRAASPPSGPPHPTDSQQPDSLAPGALHATDPGTAASPPGGPPHPAESPRGDSLDAGPFEITDWFQAGQFARPEPESRADRPIRTESGSPSGLSERIDAAPPAGQHLEAETTPHAGRSARSATEPHAQRSASANIEARAVPDEDHAQAGWSVPDEIAIAVRVNRASGALPGTHRMTGVPTPFGVDEAQLPELLHLAASNPGIRVVGFHLHAVSNNLDAEAHAAFVADSVAWSVATAGRHGVDLRLINVGGGLGVDYLSDATIDLTVLRERLADIDVPAGVELVFEPGRILAADAGWYATEVLDLKHTHGRTFAVLRGGTHHFRLPAAWGYSHPFTVLPVDDRPDDLPRPEVTDTEVDAVGELCTPRDVLTRGQHVDRLRVGDILVFARTGAYGWDISHHDFLSHPPPAFLITRPADPG